MGKVLCAAWCGQKGGGKKRALFPLYLPGLLLSCLTLLHLGLPGSSAGKESACNAGDSSYSWVRKTPWRRDRLPTPVSLDFPGGSYGKESAYHVGDLGSIFGLSIERCLRVPWAARRSNQSILKEISPNYSLEGLMLKLKLQYFGHLTRRADSFETLMLGKIAGRRRRGQQRMRWLDGITQWTWIWVDSGSW